MKLKYGNIRVQTVMGKVAAALLAVGAGAVNALFGGGGGMLIVPALSICLGCEEKKAHATAVAVMLPLSVCSAIVLTLRGIGDMRYALTVTSGTILGGLIGALLLKKLPKGLLSAVFYGVMIYAGIKYIK